MNHEPERDGADAAKTTARSPSEVLARELGGDLPCASCGYNLRGLSVRSVCPECSLPVRATILARVDPYATVLRPITWPRLTAAGLVLWSVGALSAALLTWVQRLGSVAAEAAGWAGDFRGAGKLGAACVALSALGAVMLVRPHAGVSWRRSARAGLGVALSGACAWWYWRLHVRYDGTHAAPYLAMDTMMPARSLLRLGLEGTMAGALVCLRPAARALAARSLLMRMGHVDRQTLLAVVAAIGVAAIGDGVHLAGPHAHGVLATMAGGIGNVLIAVGSMLLTVGLVGVVRDCVRLAPVVVRPPLTLGHVMEGQGHRSSEAPRVGGTGEADHGQSAIGST